MRYGKGHAWLERKAALLTRRVGKGRISYLGAWLDRAGMTNVAQWACHAAGVPVPWGRLPDGIEVSCRESADRRVHVIGNHGTAADSLDLPFNGVCAMTGTPQEGSISLPVNEVTAIVERG